MVAVTAVMLLVLALCAPAGARSANTAPQPAQTDSDLATVLARIHDRDFNGAARAAEAALRKAPADPQLTAAAALLEIEAGSAHAAQKRLRSVADERPGDSRIQYLLGICSLAMSDWPGAEAQLLASKKAGADPEAVRTALRCVKFLSTGSAGQAGQLALDSAIEAMSAAGEKRWKDAAKLAQLAALDTEGGDDPFTGSYGPQFSLNAARPIAASYVRNAAGAEPAVVDAAVSGNLLLSPTDVPRGTAYAGYELDGSALSIVGTAPFSYTWDTTRATNGKHTILIVLYDRSGTEIARVEHTMRVFNRRADSDGEASGAESSAALWEAMKLQPDRAACAYLAASATEHLGRKSEAREWYLRCAAINPAYQDVRNRLVAVGGIGQGGRAVFSGAGTEKLVALTFDDGPKQGVTEPLLEMLTSEHVPATFFVIGRHMREFPDLAKAIASAGMEIANHSYTHRSLTALSPIDAEREMLQTQAAVLATTGKLPKYMRPPGGNWNGKTAALVKNWGLTPCMWTVDVFDSEIIGAQKVAEAVLKQVRPGSIVLMHNGKVSTLQALPSILRGLRARGYRFVTVDALCNKGSGISSAGQAMHARPE